jgi:magnesium transporter
MANSKNKKIGLPPGTLIHVGLKKTDKTQLEKIEYNSKEFKQEKCLSIEECLKFDYDNSVKWINIDGLHETNIIAEIGKSFNIHNLLLEDILDTNHRPKAEEFDDYLFFTLKMLAVDKKKKIITSEQVSIILGKDWVLTFQEKPGDVFNALRTRIKDNKGVIRQKKADFLFYSIIDIIVDHYFYVIDFLNDNIEKLEEEVILNPSQKSLNKIQHYKRTLITIRKNIVPLREAVSSLQKFNIKHIEKNTYPYLRDVYEHLIHINDSIDSQRDMLSGIMDLYVSGVSNRMNEVMKVLTIIATIFIPLTFIAGIYGMNFDNMPELHWKYGYFATLFIMVVIGVAMLFYFKKKKWL